MESHDKPVLGWTEYLDFPDWKIHGMQVKVDTGARTSALHVEDLKVLPRNHVEFDVMIGRKPPFRRRTIRCKMVKWSKVRSSTGEYTVRCFVIARVWIGPMEKEIEISLVSREKMRFRMLLGRSALAHDFLVDVSKRVSFTRRKKPHTGRH